MAIFIEKTSGNWCRGRKRLAKEFTRTMRPVGNNDWAIDRLWETLNWMENGGEVARRLLSVIEFDPDVGEEVAASFGHGTYTGKILSVLRNGSFGDAKIILNFLLELRQKNPAQDPPSEMITVAEAAKRMRCSEEWIEALCEKEWAPKGLAKIMPEGGR